MANLWVSLIHQGPERTVRIDSGFLLVPGPANPAAPVVMRRLFIRPFLGLSDSSAHVDVESTAGWGQRGAWHALAAGDSVPVADSLRYGERLALRRLVTRLPAAPLADAVGARLGFRITGDGVAFQAPLAPGAGAPAARVFPGSVRVFVCSAADLRGRPDGARSARLDTAYNAAC